MNRPLPECWIAGRIKASLKQQHQKTLHLYKVTILFKVVMSACPSMQILKAC